MKSFKSFLFLLLLGVHPAAVLCETRSLPVLSVNARRGSTSVGSVGPHVLATSDLTGTEDDWYKYIEANADDNNKGFIVDFEFQYSPQSNDGAVERIDISANTKGLPKHANLGDTFQCSWCQTRKFQIRNFGAGRWEELGDNEGSDSWVWFAQTFSHSGSDLSDYISNKDRVRIRFRSNNRRDPVSNVDYLAVDLTFDTGGSGPTPTDSPVTQDPTSSPVTQSPTSSPSLRPTDELTSQPTISPVPDLGPTSKVTLPLVQAFPAVGKLSDQPLSVLQTADLSGTVDNWSKYIEVNADGGTHFDVLFEFEYSGSGVVQQIDIAANTMGEVANSQLREFKLFDYTTGAWLKIGDNTGACCAAYWEWYSQAMQVDHSNAPSNYVSPEGIVLVKFISANAADVTNIDHLEVELTVGDGPSSPVTQGPTSSPSVGPTSSPSYFPTTRPTDEPTSQPANSPTDSPNTESPTSLPTASPVVQTAAPTDEPASTPTTSTPTSQPTKIPTSSPTVSPSADPTSVPTLMPTSHPTDEPTSLPTASPVQTSAPTDAPTSAPITQAPSSYPTMVPTSSPSVSPTAIPTTLPTTMPSRDPTDEPTSQPTNSPMSGPGPTTTITLPLFQAFPAVGKISDQPLSVLETADLSGTVDNWDAYIEANADGATHFDILFEFEYVPSASAGAIQQIDVTANTMGEIANFQLREFKLFDYTTATWLTIGDNNGACCASGWEWYSQVMTVDDSSGNTPSDYVSPEGIVLVKFVSANAADVSNIDHLQVDLTVSDGPPPPPTPSSSPTPMPTSSPTVSSAPTPEGPSWWMPKSSDRLTWQWHISSTVDTSFNVDMYDIDLFDNSAEFIANLKAQGRIVVCYFSAGTYEGWRDDWRQFFPNITDNDYRGDEPPFANKMADWDERWLDIRRIDLLEPIMRSRLQLAVDKDCDAVEPDNVDAYANGGETGLPLTYNDQKAYNLWLAEAAHDVGMSIGLKNDVGQLGDLVDAFDWALNEQCFQYNECGAYTGTFIAQDKAVFGVEYDEFNQNPDDYCPIANSMGLSWLHKRLDLRAYRIGCEDYL